MKLRVLNIIFDMKIEPYEVPAFRGAIIHKIGRENTILFHNHIDDTKYLYNYPKIQYKRIGQKPAIICIEKGVDEIHHFFENADWTLQIGKETHAMKIAKLNVNQFTMNTWDTLFDYHIHHWLALNQENYKKYIKIESISEQLGFLENILKANILSFAKGINWNIEREVIIKIVSVPKQKTITAKGSKRIAYSLDFKTNVFLPNQIGLGKNVSFGFGVVHQIKENKKD